MFKVMRSRDGEGREGPGKEGREGMGDGDGGVRGWVGRGEEED